MAANSGHCLILMDDEANMYLNSILEDFPIFKGIEVSDRRSESIPMLTDDGSKQLEFFHPEDSRTGKYLMEIYNPRLKGKKLDNAIFGEFLHAAPALSPQYKVGKEHLVQTFTDAQQESNIKAYEDSGDQRPFDKYMKFSRVDAFIRGYVAEQWPDYSYTIVQRRIMDKMIDGLTKEGRPINMGTKE